MRKGGKTARPGEDKRRISAIIFCQRVENPQVLKVRAHLPGLPIEATHNKRHMNSAYFKTDDTELERS